MHILGAVASDSQKWMKEWTDPSIKDKWASFWCHLTEQIYYQYGFQWQVYARYSGVTVNKVDSAYKLTFTVSSPTATQFAALSPRCAIFQIEHNHEYEFFQPDEDPAKYDPNTDFFCRI